MEEAEMVQYLGPNLGMCHRARSPIPGTPVPRAGADDKAPAALLVAADPEALGGS